MKATFAFLILASALEVQLLAQTCSPVSMRLESRLGYGQKKKVGFGSYDPNDPYRMFLTNKWSNTTTIDGFAASLPTPTSFGSFHEVVSHTGYYIRELEADGPFFQDSHVDIMATISNPSPSHSGSSSYNGIDTFPTRASAHAYAIVLGSDGLMNWNGEDIYGLHNSFFNSWDSNSDIDSTAPEVRTVTELWCDRRTMTLTGNESGTRYGPDYDSILSSEYTTGMLIADARRRATNALASTWDPVVNPSTATLSSSLTLSNHDRTAGADMTVWRATLDHGEYGQTYEVRWLEWFIPEGGSAGKPSLRRKRFPGTGLGASVEVEVPLPSKPGVTVARVLGAFPANRSSDDPGNGAPPDMVGV